MARARCAPLRLRRPTRVALTRLSRQPSRPHRLVLRARIVLMAGAGEGNAEIARVLGVTVGTVRKWRCRFARQPKLSTLDDRHRSGRPARVPVWTRCELVKLACSPAEERTRPKSPIWTRALLQKALFHETRVWLSLSEIGRILSWSGIRPHRVRLWLHSPDPEFRPKVERICALYLRPPDAATVLCVDEKSGMQALEQRYPKRCVRGVVRKEFEYVRHGTSTLIAAFDVRTGEVYGHLRRRTAKNLVRFVEALAKRYPKGDLWIVWDNLNVHHGQRWSELNEREGGRLHFVHTPKHASWVNQIEIWFSLLTRAVLRHGSFPTRRELGDAIRAFITSWRRRARPFRWKFRGRFQSERPREPQRMAA